MLDNSIRDRLSYWLTILRLDMMNIINARV